MIRDGLFSLFCAALLCWCCNTQERAPTPVEQAVQLYREGDRTEAIRILKQLSATKPATELSANALLQLGLLYQGAGELTSAILTFQEACDLDLTALPQKERNSAEYLRSSALWQAGISYYRLQQYQMALDAFLRVENNYPFRSFCGNAYSDFGYLYAFHRGLCYDWMGLTEQAVRCYFRASSYGTGRFYRNPTASIRMAQIYLDNDKSAVLTSILDEMDRKDVPARMRSDEQALPPKEYLYKFGASRVMRAVLELHALERQKNWAGILEIMKNAAQEGHPDLQNCEQNGWRPGEASRILANHADETIPLIQAARNSNPDLWHGWLDYTLGRCARLEVFPPQQQMNAMRDPTVEPFLNGLHSSGRQNLLLEKLAMLAKDDPQRVAYEHFVQRDKTPEFTYPSRYYQVKLPATLEELNARGTENR